MDTLFSGVTAVTMDKSFRVIKDAYVGVTGQKISFVGQTPPEESAARVIKGARKVLMPGLCNAHTHAAMTLLRGYADGYALQEWLFKHIFPAEERMTDESVYWGVSLAALEMAASGTVSFTDMYDHSLAVGRAAEESGLKANLTRALMTSDENFNFAADPRAAEARELESRFHMLDGGRIMVDASVHAEYTSNRALWEQTAQYAKDRKLGMNVHVSETRREHEECKAKYGKTPARVLFEAGLFGVRAACAHCVWVEDGDIELMRGAGASAVHNPVSNQKLASGAAPVPKMLAAGLNAALGTDGMASNNSHDLFEEIKAAAIMHKYTQNDPTVITAEQALRMAVNGGFVSQGRGDETGVIAPGRDADLILLDFDKPHLTPCHDVVSNLVYSARGSDVVMTMARGRSLYENGEFKVQDAERIMREFRKSAEIYSAPGA
ncbi:MAG: amidohydrolase [Oscillospiraceae bacterium]|jgi:5-methylthioadenosine/S-adenosylhomocysteine deaminase|nr:amidohydrolase [Oscillospiraceae bacterium]